MAKKKGGKRAQQPARAGASASQQASRAAAPSPGRGINAAPPGARLVAEAAGLPCFWWRLHGIWEFVCGFISRAVYRVLGNGESAASHADAAGGLGAPSSAGLGLSATSQGDATRGARSSALNGDIYGAADLDGGEGAGILPVDAAPPAGILPIDAARAQDGGEGAHHHTEPVFEEPPLSHDASVGPAATCSMPQGTAPVAAPAPSPSPPTSLGVADADEAGMVEDSSSQSQDSGEGRIIGADAVAAATPFVGRQQIPPAPLAPLAGRSNGVPAALGTSITNPGAANSRAPGVGRRATRGAPAVPRTLTRRAMVPQVDFLDWEGFGLGALFGEESEVDEVALKYAVYCWTRSKRLDNKNFELCDICYFKDGDVVPIQKGKMKDHTDNFHKQSFPCEKKGCFVRCATRGEAGLHHLYVHEQKCKDWWRELLETQGFKMV